MTRWLVAVVLGAAVGVVVAASSAGASTARCGPPNARTLASDRVARVYSLNAVIYGCAIHGSRSYRLGSASSSFGQSRVGPLALSGTVVGYGVEHSEIDTLPAGVVVRRLTDGKQLHDDSATSRPLGAEYYQHVDAIVVKPDGAVAWTAEGGSIVSSGRNDIEVDRDDARGHAVLDTGSAIRVDSLRLRGSRLRWRHGQATRSATLR